MAYKAAGFRIGIPETDCTTDFNRLDLNFGGMQNFDNLDPN